MNISIGRVMSFAAVAAFAATGLMQGAQKATFHLPVTAHWGMVLLQPGDYSMYLPELANGDTKLLVRGEGQIAFETPIVATTQEVSTTSYLKLRQVDGNYFIREVKLGPSGHDFTFSIPKAGHREQMAMDGSKSLTVAVN
ncbi:MAG TPA: hypothetical protein VG168_02205 [Bryobacteraceae bacterium]|nr:hypothetical protein [Bryobacteraceae bacterium]